MPCKGPKNVSLLPSWTIWTTIPCTKSLITNNLHDGKSPNWCQSVPVVDPLVHGFGMVPVMVCLPIDGPTLQPNFKSNDNDG